MRSKLQFYLIIFVLGAVGIGLTFYKIVALGFPLTPGKSDAIWIVEAKIIFKAQKEPAKVIHERFVRRIHRYLPRPLRLHLQVFHS